MSSQVRTSIETAGLPTDNLLTKRTTLPEPVQQLHRRTLHTLVRIGKSPTRSQLEAWARDLRLDLDAAWALGPGRRLRACKASKGGRCPGR